MKKLSCWPTTTIRAERERSRGYLLQPCSNAVSISPSGRRLLHEYVPQGQAALRLAVRIPLLFATRGTKKSDNTLPFSSLSGIYLDPSLSLSECHTTHPFSSLPVKRFSSQNCQRQPRLPTGPLRRYARLRPRLRPGSCHSGRHRRHILLPARKRGAVGLA